MICTHIAMCVTYERPYVNELPEYSTQERRTVLVAASVEGEAKDIVFEKIKN